MRHSLYMIFCLLFFGISYSNAQFNKEKTDSLFMIALNEYRQHHDLNKVKRDKNIDSATRYHGDYLAKMRESQGSHFEDKDVPGHKEIKTPNERLKRFSEYDYGREILFSISRSIAPENPQWSYNKDLKKFIKKYFNKNLRDLSLNKILSYLSLFMWHISDSHRKAMLGAELTRCGVDIRIYDQSKKGNFIGSVEGRTYSFYIISVVQLVNHQQDRFNFR